MKKTININNNLFTKKIRKKQIIIFVNKNNLIAILCKKIKKVNLWQLIITKKLYNLLIKIKVLN